MTVGELIAELQYQDEDAEVRVAFQPSWPLRARVQNVIAQSEMEPEDDSESASDENFVWIAVNQVSTSSENPYAPREAWAGF